MSPIHTDWEHAPSADWDWLAYQHWRCCRHPGSRTQIFPIEDLDSYNQSLNRQLNPMDDFFVEIQAELSPDSEFAVRIRAHGHVHEFQIDVGQHELTIVPASETNRSQHRSHLKIPLTRFDPKQARIELSTFDHQIILHLNGLLKWQKTLDATGNPADQTLVTTNQPAIQLGGRNGAAVLHRIQIWRDVYYLAAPQLPNGRLKAHDGYHLLGDNVPVSVDSRHWGDAVIRTNSILGHAEMK